MYLTNIIEDLTKIGINRDIAISINEQLGQNGRAKICLKRNALSPNVLKNPCLISGYKIKSEKNTSNGSYIDLVIERIPN